MIRKSLYLKILLSLVLLAMLVTHIDMEQILSMARKVHVSSWIMAIFLILLQIFTLSFRWTLLINAGGTRRMNFKTSLRITAVSALANYILTTSLGGIIARIGLSMNHGFPFVKSLAATIIDRAMTLLALLILAAIFMPFLNDFLQPHVISTTSALFAMVFACVTAFGMFLAYKNRRAIIFFNRKVTISYKYLRSLFTDPALLLKIVSTSLLSQVLYFGAVYAVMNSLGADFSFIKFMAVIPMITIIASLPVGYGGWGIREGAFIYGLGLINLPIEIAFMASVQIGLISMIAAIMVGVPAFIDSETQVAIKKWNRYKKVRPFDA